jgi:DNA-binding MarR family transcriptional regulator
MSNLLGAVDGMTFTELKAVSELTDGNLSRHLSALERAKAVRIQKSFVNHRPQTAVTLTKQGRDDFLAYLQALEAVLLNAAEKVGLPQSKAAARTLFGPKPAHG